MEYPVLNFPAEKLNQAGDWVDGKLNPQFANIRSQEEFDAAVKDANWFTVLKLNMAGFFDRYNYLFFVSRIPKVLGMFLIGYVIGRSDFYKNIIQHKRLVVTVIITGLLLGLPANYFLAKQIQHHMGDYFQLKTNGLYQTIFYALGVVPLALAYVGCFMLLFKTAVGKRMLMWIAPAGKMAFSNYMMQSLIGNFVFLPVGLAYYGQVGPVYYTLFGIIIFLLQVLISTIWLKYFNYGPVEWIWRSATYKKWQPMRKQSLASE